MASDNTNGNTSNENESSYVEIQTLPERENPNSLIVVGVGASAGGIQALQDFFQNTPTDGGMAYVVILHLSPEHESHLAELLGRVTSMPVQQVTESVKLERNQVYVIPPAKHLSMEDGTLHLTTPDPTRGRRVAIDMFFRTLASAHGPESVAVVLSGTGADGALGLKHVKEAGGLTLAQEPEDAEQDGMPRNAIATGMVDYILPARSMPSQILSYWNTSRRMRLPDEASPTPLQRDNTQDAEAALRDILAHVRVQTGHDFSHYKRATVLRRVGRRLQVNELEDLPSYLDFLRRHPSESNDLLNDLLVSVTQFFRDTAAWTAVERDVIPRLFENKGHDEALRAWVCGCATGEEAYSLAILLSESAARMERPPIIQVFATDMSDDAIASAREGSYPDTIAADVSPERLRRWFYRDNGRYRVKKELRELVLFAAHDVLKDTPFSRLDLVTCRNLLIYLNREAQERVFEIFHFALRPDGRLFLGPSESADGASPLFSSTDKQHRLYVRRPFARQALPLPALPGRAVAPPVRRWSEGDLGGTPPAPSPPGRPSGPAGDLHRGLLELYAPPSVVVNEEHEILHLSDQAGRFLRFAGGEPTTNLLRVVQPDLRLELRTALYAAAGEGRDQVRIVHPVLEGNLPRTVRLTVRPVREPEAARGYFLVLFEEISEEANMGNVPLPQMARATLSSPEGDDTPRAEMAQRLEEEIARLQAQLGSTVEQYEASIEELKASNEELQAMNEELRSATEELETSKEELQSVNEELTTVNQELKARVEEVSRTNSDLQNLLAATDIATIFLDRSLSIQRYTPAAETLFNIIPTDVGRPLAHLTHRLDYHTVPDDAERVLDRLAVVEREVRSADGRHFLARLLPYRTLDDRIDGVVLTFVDITERKQAEDALKNANDQLETRVTERTRTLTQTNERQTELMRQILNAQEDERRRVSRELHDETAQDLTALLLGLAALSSTNDLPPTIQEAATRLRQTTDVLAQKVHRLAVQLRPPALDDMGLDSALNSYVTEWSNQSSIIARLEHLDSEGKRLPSEIETVIYRIVQEALTNVQRHAADAREVSVTLHHTPHEVRVLVEDDGIGFDLENQDAVQQESGRRLGVAGMQERASLVGGSLTIESAPGEGTRVLLIVPLH